MLGLVIEYYIVFQQEGVDVFELLVCKVYERQASPAVDYSNGLQQGVASNRLEANYYQSIVCIKISSQERRQRILFFRSLNEILHLFVRHRHFNLSANGHCLVVRPQVVAHRRSQLY